MRIPGSTSGRNISRGVLKEIKNEKNMVFLPTYILSDFRVWFIYIKKDAI